MNIKTQFFSLCCINVLVFANEKFELPEVNIDANITSRVTSNTDKFGGKTTISNNQISSFFKGNSDISSALKIHPNVKFNPGSKNSNNQAEISPEDISINGAFFYQNNFKIDGITANNDLNSDALKKYNDNHTLPFGLLDSKSQGINLDIDLVDEINVYDSLVPAKFGGFNGGVVDVKTKNPSQKFGGKLSISHTRSQWMRRFSDDKNQRKIDSFGGLIPHQENFKKTTYRAFAQGFVGNDFGLELAFSRTISKFPQSGFDKRYIDGENFEYLDEEIQNKIKSSFNKKLKRYQDNFFLKGVYYINDTHTLTPTITYAPGYSDNFLSHSINSYSKELSSDFSSALKLESEYENFKIEQNLAYSQLKTKRDSDTNYFISWWDRGWGVSSDDNPFSKSYEGGYGSLEQSQKSFNYNFDLLTNEFMLANTSHKINFGFEYGYKLGKFNNPQTSYLTGDAVSEAHERIYQANIDQTQKDIEKQEQTIEHYRQEQLQYSYDSPEFKSLEARIKHHEEIKDNMESYVRLLYLSQMQNSFKLRDDNGNTDPNYTKCLPNDPLCYGRDLGGGFEVEQFFKNANIYKKGSVKAKMKLFSAYIDDEIKIKNLTLRPGVRFDRDDFLHKFTISPRFGGIYDILGDQTWLVSFGANRYYGRNSFAWKLNDLIQSNLEFKGKREFPTQNFTLEKSQYNNHFSSLKAPYVDERAIGTGVMMGNLAFNAKYILRDGKDQVMVKKLHKQGEPPRLEYTNDGRSKSHIYTISLKNVTPYEIWGLKNSFELAFDYTKTRRNLESGNLIYANLNHPFANLNKPILYNGKLIKLKDKPASTFNTPWNLRLHTNTQISPLNLTFSNFFSLQGAYKMDVDVSGRDEYDNYPYQVIETKRFKPVFNWDTRLSYTQNLGKGVSAFVNLDVVNVLNKKSVTGFNNGSHDTAQKEVDYDKDAGYETLYAPGRQFWVEVGVKF